MTVPAALQEYIRGDTCAVVGAGPSLTMEQLEDVRRSGVFCIITHRVFREAPWADLLVMSAPGLHHRATGIYNLEELAGFRAIGYITLGDRPLRQNEFYMFETDTRPPKSKGPEAKARWLENYWQERAKYRCPGCGENTSCVARFRGAAALEYAVTLGFKNIVVLGFDSGTIPGRQRHFNDLNDPSDCEDEAYQRRKICWPFIATKAKGARATVYNCSPETMLDAFPVRTLSDVLPS